MGYTARARSQRTMCVVFYYEMNAITILPANISEATGYCGRAQTYAACLPQPKISAG